MKIFVTKANISTTGKSYVFKYANQPYSGTLDVWIPHGIKKASDLNGAVIEIDDNTSINKFNGFYYITARNIVEIYRAGTFNEDEHKVIDADTSKIFIEEVEEVEEIIYEEVDFDSIYEDIPFYEIKKEARVMDPVDKMIQNSVKITKTKYDNGVPNKFSFTFELLAELGGEAFIDFIKDKISTVTIKAPALTKIPRKLLHDNEAILEYLNKKNLSQYATQSMRKEYAKSLIDTEKLIFNIDKKRIDRFNKFKTLAKQAALMKHETGLNPVSLAWPYVVGKTNKGTFFHAPLAYQLIKIEESLNEYRLTKEPNFKINTYPILKNYSEQKSVVNEIIPEASSIKELLIEFYKHGIKIMKPEETKFSNYSRYQSIDQRKDKYPNNTFKLTNEVQLTLKPQDEYIYFDLKKIIVDNEEFSMPGKTFSIIEDERNIEKHRFINNVDKSKALAITKANEGSLVIFGPPGTGKSETITTLMGDIISQNKKTLFVAEKATAIEVIRDNMKKIGLDSFVVNLNNPSKRDFVFKFKRQLSLLLKNRIEKTTKPKNYSLMWNNSNEGLFNLSERLKQLIDSKSVSLESVVGISHFVDDLYEEQLPESFDTIKSDGQVEPNKIKEIYTLKDSLIKNNESLKINIEKRNTLIKEGESIYSSVFLKSNKELSSIESKIASLDNSTREEAKHSNDKIVELNEIYKNRTKLIQNSISSIKDSSDEQIKSLNTQLTESIDGQHKIKDDLIREINKNPLNEMMFRENHLGTLLKINDTSALAELFLKKKPLLFGKYIKKNNYSLKNTLVAIDDYRKEDESLATLISKIGVSIKEASEDLKITINKYNKELKELKTLNINEIENLENELSSSQDDNNKMITSLKTRKNIISLMPESLLELVTDFDSNIVDPIIDSEEQGSAFISWFERYEEINEAIKDIEITLEEINQDEIEFVIKKIAEHKIDMKTFESDINIFWEIDNNPKILENIDSKWDKFKVSMVEHVDSVRKSMISGYSTKFRNRYEDDEVFKTEIDKISRFVNNKLSNPKNSVNALFMKKYEYMKEIFPVIMMNPELVSQTFGPKENIFDYAIFDEASQIRLHKAVPALHRAKIAIVAGDDKQLGPTDLFSIESDDDHDIDGGENEELNNKTLLNYAKDMYAQVQLNTHYRSKSKDLIEFSNKEFYEGRMSITDSPLARLEGKPGIIVEEINGYWTADRTNEEEAERVLELFKHYRINLNKTVGIITFNDNQKNRIRDLLESDDELRGKMNLDDYFLKSIKDVQGDERDVVIFSITYGKREESGAYVKSFGRFSKEKINVAITRSKLRMHILKSIPSSEINESNDDYIVFKHWLSYIESKQAEPENFDEYDFDNFRSDFERDYYKSINKILPETVIALPNYPVASKEIDLVLYDKATNRFIGAIELDGSKWHGTAEQKADDFERQTYLEAMGWQFVRTTFWEYYRNRRARVERDFQALLEISRGN